MAASDYATQFLLALKTAKNVVCLHEIKHFKHKKSKFYWIRNKLGLVIFLLSLIDQIKFKEINLTLRNKNIVSGLFPEFRRISRNFLIAAFRKCTSSYPHQQHIHTNIISTPTAYLNQQHIHTNSISTPSSYPHQQHIHTNSISAPTAYYQFSQIIFVFFRIPKH